MAQVSLTLDPSHLYKSLQANTKAPESRQNPRSPQHGNPKPHPPHRPRAPHNLLAAPPAPDASPQRPLCYPHPPLASNTTLVRAHRPALVQRKRRTEALRRRPRSQGLNRVALGRRVLDLVGSGIGSSGRGLGMVALGCGADLFCLAGFQHF